MTPRSTRWPPRPDAAYRFLDVPQGEVHSLSGGGLGVFVHYTLPVRKYSLSHNIFAVYTFVDHSVGKEVQWTANVLYASALGTIIINFHSED